MPFNHATFKSFVCIADRVRIPHFKPPTYRIADEYEQEFPPGFATHPSYFSSVSVRFDPLCVFSNPSYNDVSFVHYVSQRSKPIIRYY